MTLSGYGHPRDAHARHSGQGRRSRTQRRNPDLSVSEANTKSHLPFVARWIRSRLCAALGRDDGGGCGHFSIPSIATPDEHREIRGPLVSRACVAVRAARILLQIPPAVCGTLDWIQDQVWDDAGWDMPDTRQPHLRNKKKAGRLEVRRRPALGRSPPKRGHMSGRGLRQNLSVKPALTDTCSSELMLALINAGPISSAANPPAENPLL